MAARKVSNSARVVRSRTRAKAVKALDVKTGRAVRKISSDIDRQSDLSQRVDQLESKISGLEARMTRLFHQFTAVRAVWQEGVKALEI